MKRPINNQRGAALLTVLVAMMIIFIMLFEFQYNTMVERKLAYNDLNQLQAYYLAKAGARIGLLRVSLYGKARRSSDITKLMKGSVDQYLDQIWALPLPSFPPAKSSLSNLDTQDKAAAEKVLEQTKVSEGNYSHTIGTEGTKLNLNQLILPANRLNDRIDFSAPPQAMYQYVARMLANLIQSILEASENPDEEYGVVRPEEMVMDIMDWVNLGANRFAGGSKDAWYEDQKPPYKAKRHRFYTIEELRLVRGITDKMFTKLKPHVTVYSEDGRINLNLIGETMLRAIYGRFTEDDIKRILEERANRNGWAKEGDFVDFVTKNLNRNDFTSYYPDAQNYPFSVSGRAFLIESLGQIAKSGSSIQKAIQIGIALTTPRPGQILPQYTTADACKRAGKMYYTTAGSCLQPPTNQAECESITGASWTQNGTQNICRTINGEPYVVPNTSSTATAPPEPDSMKILYWSET